MSDKWRSIELATLDCLLPFILRATIRHVKWWMGLVVTSQYRGRRVFFLKWRDSQGKEARPGLRHLISHATDTFPPSFHASGFSSPSFHPHTKLFPVSWAPRTGKMSWNASAWWGTLSHSLTHSLHNESRWWDGVISSSCRRCHDRDLWFFSLWK